MSDEEAVEPTEDQIEIENVDAVEPTEVQIKIENVDAVEEDDEEDDDEDDVKVTIDDFDMKTLQKQQQSTAKPAAPIFDLHQEPIECQQLDDKPWRKPGADVTDYFNYGFDEFTWQKYCDRQKQIKGIADEIKEPPTFSIPVVYGPMVQANVVAYDDHVVMDHGNAPIAQEVGMQHQQHQLQHHPSGGSGRMKNVDDERRRNRSRERRHVSRERRHARSRDQERERERDRENNKERKRSRSRDRHSKVSKSRQRSSSRDTERRSKRQKTSRHA